MPVTDRKPPRVVLGFDWGTQSIGMAVGQSVTATASPLKALSAKHGVPDWSRLQALVAEWQPDLFIVGIPLNMDGSESESSLQARKFGRRLSGRFAIPWAAMDERLSSFEAKSRLAETGQAITELDSFAAKLIVESWFEYQRRDSGPGSPPD